MPAFYGAGPNGLWIFLLVTLVMGGAAAFVSGRTLAQTWRPLWQLPVYMLLLAAGVRFIHYALFGERLVAPASYLSDFAVLCVVAAAGFIHARHSRMREQYYWLMQDDG